MDITKDIILGDNSLECEYIDLNNRYISTCREITRLRELCYDMIITYVDEKSRDSFIQSFASKDYDVLDKFLKSVRKKKWNSNYKNKEN